MSMHGIFHVYLKGKPTQLFTVTVLHTGPRHVVYRQQARIDCELIYFIGYGASLSGGIATQLYNHRFTIMLIISWHVVRVLVKDICK